MLCCGMIHPHFVLVKKAIDKFAVIDYSMTAAPKFTSQYMDIFIRVWEFPCIFIFSFDISVSGSLQHGACPYA